MTKANLRLKDSSLRHVGQRTGVRTMSAPRSASSFLMSLGSMPSSKTTKLFTSAKQRSRTFKRGSGSMSIRILTVLVRLPSMSRATWMRRWPQAKR
jgi:hypothetical protein